MKLVSRLMLAVFLLAAGSAATSAQPFPNPIVKYGNQFPDLGLVHVNLTVVNWTPTRRSTSRRRRSFRPAG